MNSIESVESIMSRVIARDHSADDLGKLIERFSDGRSIDKLSRLIDDEDSGSIADGLYVLSEVGSPGWSLIPKAAKLIDHESEDVRYFSMASVAACPSAIDMPTLVKCLGMMADRSKRVRWKTIQLVSLIDKALLGKAREFMCENEPGNLLHIRGIGLVLDTRIVSADGVLRETVSSDVVSRGYAVAASAIMFDTAREALNIAAKSDDVAVSEFAKAIQS